LIKPINFQHNNSLVSREAFQAHLELYRQYCAKYNEIQEELKEYAGCEYADKNYSRYRGMKREEAHNLNAILLHEYYFKNLSNRNTSPSEHFASLVKQSFGSFEDWQRDFTATAKASRGWAVVCYEQRTGRVCNMLIDNHDIGVPVGVYLLLVLDCWEHSYIFNYQNNINKYIENFFQNIDWDVVENRAKIISEQ